jgi:hypothetical protein
VDVESLELSPSSKVMRLGRVEANATGYYSLFVPSSPILILVSIDGGDGYVGKIVAKSTFTSDKILDFVIPSSMWNGTVVDVNGAPVSSLVIYGRSEMDLVFTYRNFDYNLPSGAFYDETSATGEFSFLVSGLNSYNLVFIPPTGSHYLQQTFNSLMIDITKFQTVVLSTGVLLSGKVIIPSGLVSSRLSVYVTGIELSTGSKVADVQANATGYYSLAIAPSSPTLIRVSLDYSSSYQTATNYESYHIVTDLTLTSDKILDLITPGSMWNGTVVDVNGAPVSSVAISGDSVAYVGYDLEVNLFRRHFNAVKSATGNGFRVVTSATGEFSVHVSELNSYNVIFAPPTGSPLPIQSRILTINPTSPQTIVLQTTVPSASPSQAPPSPIVVFVVLQITQVIIHE